MFQTRCVSLFFFFLKHLNGCNGLKITCKSQQILHKRELFSHYYTFSIGKRSRYIYDFLSQLAWLTFVRWSDSENVFCSWQKSAKLSTLIVLVLEQNFVCDKFLLCSIEKKKKWLCCRSLAFSQKAWCVCLRVCVAKMFSWIRNHIMMSS